MAERTELVPNHLLLGRDIAQAGCPLQGSLHVGLSLPGPLQVVTLVVGPLCAECRGSRRQAASVER